MIFAACAKKFPETNPYTILFAACAKRVPGSNWGVAASPISCEPEGSRSVPGEEFVQLDELVDRLCGCADSVQLPDLVCTVVLGVVGVHLAVVRLLDRV